jgi:hypothetical protein
MAGKAKDGITFTGEIEGHSLLGQFTTARFKENDELIAVINENCRWTLSGLCHS